MPSDSKPLISILLIPESRENSKQWGLGWEGGKA